jgi:hypothetical protein
MPNSSEPLRTVRSRGAIRILATVVGIMLVFASVAPPFALAEAETEGEGTAPPGGLPGLEEGELGGGETALEEAPLAAGEEGAEEAPPPAEVEVTPPPASSETTVPATEEPVPAPEVTQPVPLSPPASTPVYGPEESEPSYQPATEPHVPAVVRNEAIVAPETKKPEAASPAPPHTSTRTPVGEGAESSPEPVEAPESVVSQVAPPPPSADPSPSIRGHRSYTVAPGDCLWSIAGALLRPGASNAEIAAEVSRLWRMNAATIGTGDPNVLLVGTVLRLG